MAADARRLMALSMVGPLAEEVAAQIDANLPVEPDSIVNADVNSAAAIALSKLAFGADVASLVALTDSSGGTPGNTIADVPASYTEATLANQLASLAGKINEIIAALKP